MTLFPSCNLLQLHVDQARAALRMHVLFAKPRVREWVGLQC